MTVSGRPSQNSHQLPDFGAIGADEDSGRRGEPRRIGSLEGVYCMNIKLSRALCATTALATGLLLSSQALAQSTGTAIVEELVVTGITRPAQPRRRHRRRERAQVAGRDHRRVHQPPDARPVDPGHDQPAAGRQLHQQRPLRLGRRRHHHPRLRQPARRAAAGRRSAERQRQLRDLPEPAARIRPDREGHGEPGHHRRGQPHRGGRRRHDQLHHPPRTGRVRRPRRSRRRRATTTSATTARSNSGAIGPWGTKPGCRASTPRTTCSGRTARRSARTARSRRSSSTRGIDQDFGDVGHASLIVQLQRKPQQLHQPHQPGAASSARA